MFWQTTATTHQSTSVFSWTTIGQATTQHRHLVVQVIAATQVKEQVEHERRVMIGNDLVAQRQRVLIGERRLRERRRHFGVHQRQLIELALKLFRDHHHILAECCHFWQRFGVERHFQRVFGTECVLFPVTHHHLTWMMSHFRRKVMPIV